MEKGNIDYEGVGWEITYIKPDPRLSLEDRNRISWETIDMCKKEIEERCVKGEGFEGRIRFKNLTSYFGLHGPEYEAEVETNSGKAFINYLVIMKVEWPADPRSKKEWN